MMFMQNRTARRLCWGAVVLWAVVAGADVVGALEGNRADPLPAPLHEALLCLILVSISVGMIRLEGMRTARMVARSIRSTRTEVAAVKQDVAAMQALRESSFASLTRQLDEIRELLQADRSLPMRGTIEEAMARAHVTDLFEEYRGNSDGLPGGLPKQ